MSDTQSTSPRRFCDLVMKGGITSGVVYPLAAVRLSEQFVFKNIGGTSAGAIAAAATAAAEHARARGGFERLKQLPEFLAGNSPEKGKNNLLTFFQPQPATRRLFRLCLAGLGEQEGRGGRLLRAALRSYRIEALIGALFGLGFFYLAWRCSEGAFLVVCGAIALILACVGVAVALVCGLVRDLGGALPDNFYGLCSGLTEEFSNVKGPPPEGKGKPLTFWLNEYLNEFVQRTHDQSPLTFGELWGEPGSDGGRAVNLEMMTTCLTHGRPYRLPFRDDEEIRENGLFYFRPDEFRKLFPESVVQWMESHPRPEKNEKSAASRAKLKEKGFLPLPAPADLPVVVAVRMSLSFPVLLSAVPLHAIDRSRDPEGETPERCWFSDGGVCSNFPVHFFDSPLPRWPTLSINLLEKPSGTKPEDLLAPEMCRSNSAGIQETWNRFEVSESLHPDTQKLVAKRKAGLGRPFAFAWALVATMQNWSDHVQSRLPGYRDRIAAVGLTPDEGGLNLCMPKERIDQLTQRGQAAGEEFVRRFGYPSAETKMNWENHRWIRLRSCFGSLEAMLISIDHACANPQIDDMDYMEWVTSRNIEDIESYKWDSEAQRQLAVSTLVGLRKIRASILDSGRTLANKAPRPRPELRPRAQI